MEHSVTNAKIGTFSTRLPYLVTSQVPSQSLMMDVIINYMVINEQKKWSKD
jgi:hypothetical protein